MVAISTIGEAACVFLAAKRVAVTRVQERRKTGREHRVPATAGAGYTVFALDPNAQTIEGNRAYHTLGSIPGGVEAVVVGTAPQTAQATIQECVELGIGRVWSTGVSARAAFHRQPLSTAERMGSR